MQAISGLGLITLLLLSWAISYHRTKVRLRPVIWGMGLQFIFALIILRQDWASYAGMGAFTLLLVNFTMREQKLGDIARVAQVGIVSATALAASAVFYFLGLKIDLTFIIVLIGLLAVANAFFLKKTALQPILLGLLFCAIFGHLVATKTYGGIIFRAFSDGVEAFLGLSDYGARFMFGNLADETMFFTGENASGFPGFGFQFAFKVLPTIIFFGGFMSVLYYLGLMQKVIESMSKFMRWTIGTSGAETLSCTANVFVGQTEAPLLIRPFLNTMTKSELLTIMVGGFATIAGGVLAGYINMGVDAGHLLAASVMSAPAALVIGKIIYPETEHSETAGDVALPKIDSGDNVLEAAATGISDGLKLALNVGAMLIGFIALIAVLDLVLNYFDFLIDHKLLGAQAKIEYDMARSSPVTGEYPGIFPGSLQTFFSFLFKPLAWLMGVPWEDAGAVGNLLGMKLGVNEFLAYQTLGDYIRAGDIGARAEMISTYALCGFANFSSIGIQLGGFGALAPERRNDLAKVALKAMFGGAFASWTTACVAGLLI